jgi:uncharacterized membrane protein
MKCASCGKRIYEYKCEYCGHQNEQTVTHNAGLYALDLLGWVGLGLGILVFVIAVLGTAQGFEVSLAVPIASFLVALGLAGLLLRATAGAIITGVANAIDHKKSHTD